MNKNSIPFAFLVLTKLRMEWNCHSIPTSIPFPSPFHSLLIPFHHTKEPLIVSHTTKISFTIHTRTPSTTAGTMTAKDCSHDNDERKKLHRHLLVGGLGFLLLVLFLILLIWLILQPSKPHFVLQDATVFAFNLSSASTLSTTIQVTLAARNSNERIGIYYDRVDVYVAYHGQQITLPTLFPPTYQGHKDSVVWSPFLYGDAVPVAPYLGVALNQDQIAGRLMVNVRVRGRIRWKVGTFISGGYHLYVNCPAYINSGDAAAIKYHLIMDCHVDV